MNFLHFIVERQEHEDLYCPHLEAGVCFCEIRFNYFVKRISEIFFFFGKSKSKILFGALEKN